MKNIILFKIIVSTLIGSTFVNCNSETTEVKSVLNKPKLVVAVVVDQMMFDYLNK